MYLNSQSKLNYFSLSINWNIREMSMLFVICSFFEKSRKIIFETASNKSLKLCTNWKMSTFADRVRDVVVKKVSKTIKKKLHRRDKKNRWYECDFALLTRRKIYKRQFFQLKKKIRFEFFCDVQFEMRIHLHDYRLIWFAARRSNIRLYQI